MANKKRNKNTNNKQKSNNNNKFSKNHKNGPKSRQNSEQSVNSSVNSSQKSSKVTNSINRSEHTVDIFGDSDRRVDVNCGEKPLKTSDSMLNSKSTHSTNYSPKGLNNLGNTCYLNSVLQIISETHLLFDLLNERSNDGYVYRVKALRNVNDWSPDRPADEEIETTLGLCFPLTQNLIGFMREMRANGSRTVNPGKLLNSIRKEWTQFDGWAQQDSHELLRCLLDSLKCKEVRRQRKAIIEDIKTTSESDPNGDDNNLDDDAKARIKSYANYSSLTPIDTVFGGQILSSVCCEVCQTTSLKFEPFFDLSLPLTQLKNSYSNNNSVLIEKNEPKNSRNESNERKTTENTSLTTNTDKKMTPKERRQQRQQKKASKREEKLQKKALNTIPIENKENYDNICDKTDGTAKTDNISDEKVWPEVGAWNNDEKNGTNGAKLEEEGNKDLSEEHNSDSNPEVICPTASADWTTDWVNKSNDWSQQMETTEDDIDIEPLLSDFGDKLVLNTDIKEWDVSQKPSKECNGGEDDDILSYIDMLYDNNQNRDNKDNENNDYDDAWNDEGWPLNDMPPVFGPELPPNVRDLGTDAVDEYCDESKAQDLEFQSSIECEAELLMSSISDREKLEIKQSTTDPSNASIDFDPNSESIKRITNLCLQTINENESLPKFDLMRLLSNFTAVESLSGSNKYFCEVCTKSLASNKDKQFTNASKRALIALPPPVLTLHLKRFEAEGYRRSISLKKISTFVSFPLAFDLSPFVSKMYNYLRPITGQSLPATALIYGLYGVVEHSGSLRSGHYTAYVKFRPNVRNQIKKFAVLEPFLPKVENVLKMIENKFFGENSDNSPANGLSNGCHPTANGFHTNGTTSIDDIKVEDVSAEEEYSCSANDSGKWFHMSDTSVSASSLNSVLKSNAYILFYERIA